MTHPRFVWLLAACWIAICIAVFLVIDASSMRKLAVSRGDCPRTSGRTCPAVAADTAADGRRRDPWSGSALRDCRRRAARVSRSPDPLGKLAGAVCAQPPAERELHVRVFAAVVFGAIITNLVVQLFSRHI